VSRPERQPRDPVPSPDPIIARRLEFDVGEVGVQKRPSPARALQQAVEDSWGPQAPTVSQRWLPRSTLLFSGGASLLLWAAIIGAVLGAVRLFDR
jgi:hypothetical protein